MNLNDPQLWKEKLPRKSPDGHKYTSGHLVIYGAPKLTGATRLAATAAARTGAGLVSVLANPETAAIYRTSLPACILVRDELSWASNKITTRVYGPGGLPCNIDFEKNIPTILDAGALADLPERLSPDYLLTPHEGEFARLFPNLEGDRIKRAVQAAKHKNCYVLLKGPETVIASPDGHYILNTHASPHLATAGTGDVLAGLIGALAAQGMPLFDAACAGAWIHGECARIYGHGLIADDIPGLIPKVMNDLLQEKENV